MPHIKREWRIFASISYIEGHSMRRKELLKKINSIPRVRLAALPTPLQEVPRFSTALSSMARKGAGSRGQVSKGPRIFIKRDDLTGLAMGGNKTRMFEFLLAKAQKEGADTIVGGAGVQSNYCRQLVSACNLLGMEVHLILRRIRGARDDEIQGNLLLDLLAGARVRIIKGGEEEQREAILELAADLKRKGKKPFVVRMAGVEDLTSDVIGYVNCFCEITEQCEVMGINPSRLYLASYDSTQAGLELGRVILGSRIEIVGVAPGIWKSKPNDLVARYANQAAQALGFSFRLKSEDIRNTTEFVGRGYGIPTPLSVKMIKLLARTEGIFLDPVYTSKAMSALYTHIEKGEISDRETVLFLHTGGVPALFAYVDELEKEELMERLSFD